MANGHKEQTPSNRLNEKRLRRARKHFDQATRLYQARIAKGLGSALRPVHRLRSQETITSRSNLNARELALNNPKGSKIRSKSAQSSNFAIDQWRQNVAIESLQPNVAIESLQQHLAMESLQQNVDILNEEMSNLILPTCKANTPMMGVASAQEVKGVQQDIHVASASRSHAVADQGQRG